MNRTGAFALGAICGGAVAAFFLSSGGSSSLSAGEWQTVVLSDGCSLNYSADAMNENGLARGYTRYRCAEPFENDQGIVADYVERSFWIRCDFAQYVQTSEAFRLDGEVVHENEVRRSIAEILQGSNDTSLAAVLGIPLFQDPKPTGARRDLVNLACRDA